jgi:hypothetical protein
VCACEWQLARQPLIEVGTQSLRKNEGTAPVNDLRWRETGGYWESDHTLMSEAQLAQCVRAYELGGRASSAIPTCNVSNGEYLPKPQSRLQQRVEARVHELVEECSKKLGVTTREFASGSGGIAAGLVAMNEVYGHTFSVSPSAMLDAGEFEANSLPKDLFVFDDQLHFVRGQFPGTPALRAFVQGPSAQSSGFASNPYNPQDLPDEFGETWQPHNPAIAGLPITPDNFHIVQFIKDVFLDSQVTVGLISNVTAYVELQPGKDPAPTTSVEVARDSEILTAAQTTAARNFINELAGSRRALSHGLLYTGVGNLDYIQYQIENHKPDSWKGYTITDAAKVDDNPRSLMRRWRQDDEDVAYPTYDLIARTFERVKHTSPGFNNICVHKGLVPSETPEMPEMGHPADLPRACRDWPQLNFITYHSCVKDEVFDYPAFRTIRAAEAGEIEAIREGVPDIAWTTLFAQSTAGFSNSYAELGTTFASSVVAFPTVTAHILGQLLKYKGEDQIVFGSDSVWYGSPQWQLEAFWRFEMPDQLREKWGYPDLTDRAKRKILGLTSARLYGLGSDPSTYRAVPEDYEGRMSPQFRELMEIGPAVPDNLTRIRSEYRSARGAGRSNVRYGWIRRAA